MRYRELLEKYTTPNSQLLRYFRKEEFDPYTYWSELRLWFEEHPRYVKFLAKKTKLTFADADELNEEEPELFYKLPKKVQEQAAEWVIEWLLQHDPAEAPTYRQVGLHGPERLIRRSTWLIHFTDQPDEVATEGFKYGAHDMNKLALTTYMSNTGYDKGFGGYNFAFLAGSHDASNAERKRKYGKHAVIFQNSGVMTYHYADEEQQVIFSGKDVDPRDMVILRRYDDWRVEPRRRTRRSGRAYVNDALYAGDFEPCVEWVQTNFAQYRHYLTLR